MLIGIAISAQWAIQKLIGGPPIYDGLAANLTTDEDGAFVAFF